MADTHFDVTRQTGLWAVKHNGGVLGYAKTEAEAVAVARHLIEWLGGQGRHGELHVEPAGDGLVKAASERPSFVGGF